jgi:hypothetical protein
MGGAVGAQGGLAAVAHTENPKGSGEKSPLKSLRKSFSGNLCQPSISRAAIMKKRVAIYLRRSADGRRPRTSVGSWRRLPLAQVGK